MYAMLEVEAQDLLERQMELQAKKNKLGLVDSPEEIEKLHRLLGNFEAVWPTFGLDQRQRAFRLLINLIAVEMVSLTGYACRLAGSMQSPRVSILPTSGKPCRVGAEYTGSVTRKRRYSNSITHARPAWKY